jgi:cellulose synthase/poly-beta-1,6-N-acetylglucosamine synthase-like glycosyltransferase
VGYPAWIWLLGRLRHDPVQARDITPTVTCVLAARNEARAISAKLANLLSLDYPPEFFDIVVVSDGSSDLTAPIVEEWARRLPGRVTLIALPVPRGKACALNAGLAAARGEIILFADARQRFETGALRALVRSFADPRVGAVSGALVLEEAAPTEVGAGLGFYWRLEKFLRREEARSGSTIGCTGAIYAARRALLDAIPDSTLLDDVLIPVRIVLGGHRVVFEERAHAFDTVVESAGREFSRKVRTIAGNVQLLQLCPALVNPLNGAVAWRFVSHKILPRVLMPYCLCALLVTSAMLTGWIYRVALAAQLVEYAAGVAGLVLGARGGRFFAYPAAFLLLNAAGIVAMTRYLTGSRENLWSAPPSPVSRAAGSP